MRTAAVGMRGLFSGTQVGVACVNCAGLMSRGGETRAFSAKYACVHMLRRRMLSRCMLVFVVEFVCCVCAWCKITLLLGLEVSQYCLLIRTTRE